MTDLLEYLSNAKKVQNFISLCNHEMAYESNFEFYFIFVDCERQIFQKLFHGNFILLLGLLPEICWEEVAKEIFLW